MFIWDLVLFVLIIVKNIHKHSSSAEVLYGEALFKGDEM